MSRKLTRISLVLAIFLSSEVWALGLGEIRLDSALNEPLRAEIQLLSATPEELANLEVSLASAETFERYGLDRPGYLSGIDFRIIPSGRVDGNVIELQTSAPVTEPFLTFLIEAAWARGRLLREYTVLLDPPTFAPPAAAQTAPAVTAPTRRTPADSGRIERAAPAPEAAPAPRAAPVQPPQTAQVPQAAPVPAVDDTPYAIAAGGDVYVERGDTLWGITQRVRPDSRLTVNQTMLAIFEANPEAFAGNINMLRAGSVLRIPSADQIFRISRGEALSEVRRQNDAWSGGAAPDESTTRPSLTLVPPDDEYVDDGLAAGAEPDAQPLTREQEIEQRLAEIEAADVPVQRSLIEIRNDELAALREELARIRGEVYIPPVEELPVEEPPVEEPFVDDLETESGEGPFVDDIGVEDEIVADDAEAAAEDTRPAVEEPPPAAAEPEPEPVSRAPQRQAEPTIVDRILGILTSVWTIVVVALVIVAGVLFWFLQRGRGEPGEPEAWGEGALDAEKASGEDFGAAESLRAPSPGDESFVVVEQGGTQEQPALSHTMEVESGAPGISESGQFGSLEDTFSSDTAVNLDQSDPIAEADFHMAYGLYDQAADLVKGALKLEPERQDLLTKLCEIYFVWGNRDAFVDAAGRLKNAIGESDSADWDKIVIMGQQIAADDTLFAGAGVAAATRAVDLSFDEGMDETGALDMELIAEASGESEVLDIGTPDEDAAVPETVSADVVDFDFGAAGARTQGAELVDLDISGEPSVVDLDLTEDASFGEGPDIDLSGVEASEVDLDLTEEALSGEGPDIDLGAEGPSVVDLDLTEEALSGAEADFDQTAELRAAEDTVGAEDVEPTIEAPKPEPTIETPTIEQQFAGLGATTELPAIDESDLGESPEALADATSEINLDDLGLDVSGLEDIDLTSESAALTDSAFEDVFDEAGVSDEIEEAGETTGKNPEVDPSATGVQAVLRTDDAGTPEASDFDETDVATHARVDDQLLDATGVTQILDDDQTVEGMAGVGADYGGDDGVVDDDPESLLASLDKEDEGDYDFAKTEALPADVFTGDATMEETGELPAIATTDLDLDLDDLTAALQVSDAGDTVEQVRDDATVEQPRPGMAYDEDDTSATVALAPGEMDENLHEARTMTEVGTKLDLARAYVDMGDPDGARSILQEVLDEGDEGQRQQAQQLLDSLPAA